MILTDAGLYALEARRDAEKEVEKLLRDSLTARNVTYKWHDADTSLVEAVLSRGDRRLGGVLEAVFRAGGRLDAWDDYFSFPRWMEAMADAGLDPAFYANRQREKDEVLPWSMINVGVRDDHLWRERDRCYESVLSPDCRKQCSACGAAGLLKGGKCDG